VAVGLCVLALPIAAAISLIVAGAKWPPVDPISIELSGDVLGVWVPETLAVHFRKFW